ncbi:MAG: ribonuclease PH [Aminobacterium sp.]|jgi:ribonuclease PH|uniref:ribonuclease PH n=1 Tax=Aminobacterium sp. MB27-C1 TaxID=3070661 RepID=UPI001BCAA1D4|nr:ribonuclease PH [Aminobacterium sp. MB27-C1]MDD2207525.1 ribonuclease PH [Aminobacterium sp.]MDD3426366.1 ribonuclease PH [Aminobacterium sp.]MDD3707514.1 ribonuclease PH [Aminobacterium sp.]MDD4229367.1 ribonuclease PH [Aminobacterium sp.]MDD4552353.1 ribonuclease PH [Aminobacterium sp.]
MENIYVRSDGRKFNDMRPITFERGYTCYAEGSVLACFGQTKVICTASVEEKIPSFLKGSGQGWITAEYAMLPRATAERTTRSTTKGTINGRSQEIQRLIGRSLRAAVDLSLLGERTIWLDCDVIQADGGTRTAAISGAFIALFDALRYLRENKKINTLPLKSFIGAVSVGKIQNGLCLDLCYEEDSRAEVDCNVVMNGNKELIEIQGTGEQGIFARDELNAMLDLAEEGLQSIMQHQVAVLDITEEERQACVGEICSFCQQ